MKTIYSCLLAAGLLAGSVLMTSAQAAPCVASSPTPEAGQTRWVLREQLSLSAQQALDWDALIATIEALEQQRQQQLAAEIRARENAAAQFSAVLGEGQRNLLAWFNTPDCEPGSSTPKAGKTMGGLLHQLQLQTGENFIASILTLGLDKKRDQRPDWWAYVNTLNQLPAISQQHMIIRLENRKAAIARFYNTLTPKQRLTFDSLGGLV